MFCRLTRWIDRITPIVFQIERRPGAKISLTDYLLRHPVNDASRVSVYNYTITVAKIRIISNSLGYAKLDNTAGLMKAKSKVSNVLAKKSAIFKLVCKSPPDQGEKSCAQTSTNQPKMAEICISECNDRKAAKVAEPITECQLSQLEIPSIPNNYICNFPLTSLKLKKLIKLSFQYPDITSEISSEIEEVDARLEAVTTGSSDVKCNTVISIP